MPREKIPASIKEKTGTLRPDREQPKTTADALVKIPKAPDGLSKRAAAEWNQVGEICVELGTISKADLRALELLCEMLATTAEAQEVIKAEGMTVQAGAAGPRAHPAIKIMESARTQAINLLRDFGLTPKARNYVSPAPAAKTNKFKRNGV